MPRLDDTAIEEGLQHLPGWMEELVDPDGKLVGADPVLQSLVK